MRKRILNQPIDIINLNAAAYLAKMALIHPKQLKIITLNPEMVVNAVKNPEFQAAINNSHLIVPDGIGIILASKIVDYKTFQNIERVPGIELAEKILEAANELGKKVALFGGKKEILEKVLAGFSSKYSSIKIIKAVDGYQGVEKHAEIASDIASENPDLVLVALGTPKQEIWINKYSSLFPRSIMMGIGGSFDVWSGRKSRAPKWIRNIYLEWFYRLIIDPKRIPRILKTLPQFAWMVFRASLQTKLDF
ncbi:MAG: WecB/TagA/CpsF family glycosyltransferase [Candidatus Melainabacteria bacterium]|nr:WecB/TagA/CpsF family glycosyltransferase [Candidatus Melainabacteria bacterium]